MHKKWWKILSVIILVYTFTAGLLWNNVPRLPVLGETIRNLYFHVCMWFAMMILFTASVVYAVRYLNKGRLQDDIYSRQFAIVGILFGFMGYATGAVWASYSWADPNKPAWESFSAIARDPKLIGAAIALFIYAAYLILRDSIQDIDKKARISAVYNVFAYAMLFPAIWIIPRLVESLHPGGDGSDNPAFDKNTSPAMRAVFYPAIIGWTLLGVWIVSLRIRIQLLKEKSLLSSYRS
jgi:heme exporter protein C